MPESVFQPPRKVILTPAQLSCFQASDTHKEIIHYISQLNESVVGVKLGDPCPISPGISALLDLLSEVGAVAKGIPPVQNSASRFGNPAFRTFYDKISEVGIPLFEVWHTFSNHRYQPLYIPVCRIYNPKQYPKWKPTLKNRGAIGRG